MNSDQTVSPQKAWLGSYQKNNKSDPKVRLAVSYADEGVGLGCLL
jgi:hypothetical protein